MPSVRSAAAVLALAGTLATGCYGTAPNVGLIAGGVALGSVMAMQDGEDDSGPVYGSPPTLYVEALAPGLLSIGLIVAGTMGLFRTVADDAKEKKAADRVEDLLDHPGRPRERGPRTLV